MTRTRKPPTMTAHDFRIHRELLRAELRPLKDEILRLRKEIEKEKKSK